MPLVNRAMMIKSAATMAILKKAKMVSEVGTMPMLSSVKWPAVAMVSGIEPEMPACQITKPE